MGESTTPRHVYIIRLTFTFLRLTLVVMIATVLSVRDAVLQLFERLCRSVSVVRNRWLHKRQSAHAGPTDSSRREH